MLTVDTSANLPFVLADRGRLKQVLLNLGSNAIKYNIESGWVLLAAYPTDEHMVRFVVRDPGPGIPPERQDQLFQPFNRLGAELGTEDGTGIGLAITRKLVFAMPINLHNMARFGFDHVVTKPFKVPDFVEVVRKMLKAA